MHGKGSKIRFLPLHPVAAERIYAYLERDVERDAAPGPLFRSMRGTTTGAGVTANGLYTIVAQWARVAGIQVERLGVHGLRATAATCSGSRLKTRVLAISAFFGSDYLRVSGAAGSD
ncbi:hypothetical protein ALO94_02759 [Pseudomonas syringae pv. spinaceae]|uniref:Tyr recombinase domain-containing protein n=1 Tax=Pseudomonas syringae pv. spinaceae TaxID=264459 RepID=A0A0N8SZ09_PSESX|nr:hypothetical protein ALO94_02759 [Pseudomonas syringae pv. spinaceae]